jgi:hypothetical protein
MYNLTTAIFPAQIHVEHKRRRQDGLRLVYASRGEHARCRRQYRSFDSQEFTNKEI